MKIVDVLIKAKHRLKESGIDEREARLLLSHVLGIRSEDLVKYDEIEEATYEVFQSVLEKRCNHIPYAYITGHQEFMKLDFKVNENVLIPRSDTEILVEEAIKLCQDKSLDSILDVCTGSGCIAVSLAKYIKDANVTALDISKEALDIAKENAIINNVNVEFIESDLFENIYSKFDIIVSNPPYIKKDVIDTLEREVKNNEPLIALDGGEDGLVFYRRIIECAKDYLEANGYLLLEIGFDQANDVKGLLERSNYKNIRVIKDYSGNDRLVVANI